MTTEQEKAKKEYLETLGRNGEIEFLYNGHFYHIEPESESNTYHVWSFTNQDGENGEEIACGILPSELLEKALFEGKTILEIEDDMTDCILR